MPRIIHACACLLLLGVLSACQSAVVSIGAVDTPAPVLVGPVLQLGGQAIAPPATGTGFSGGAVAVPAEPVRVSGKAPVSADVTEWLSSRDDLPQRLAQALAGQPGQALYVERIRVIDAVHWTALFVLDKRLLAEGHAFLPAGKQNRQEAQ